MSFIIWPKEWCRKFFCLRALMETLESPSNIELGKPNSWIRWIAHLASIVSRITTEGGMIILSDIAAITSPWEFRTTTPMPALFKSSNMALSKLVLQVLVSGSFHTLHLGLDVSWGLSWRLWNSLRLSRVVATILARGKTGSRTRVLFLLCQISQQIIANKFGLRCELLTKSRRSTKKVRE